MTTTLVDTNVFIDILGSGSHAQVSLAGLADALKTGGLILSVVVFAELAAKAKDEATLLLELSWLNFRREPLPFAAAFPAGQAHRLYRERGGRRERTLPDFLIGAHALVGGHRLLTRDPARYAAYFPELDIVSTESRP